MSGRNHVIYTGLKKGIFGIVLALLGAELVYVLVANILINTSLGSRIATRHPQKLDVKWESGYSLYPGQVSLSGFTMRFQKNRNKWSLSADHLSGHIGLERLIRRHFHVSSVAAEGVSYRYIRLEEPVPDPAPDRPHWLITLDAFEAHAIHSIEAFDYQLAGTASASGSLRYLTRRELEVFPSQLKLKDGVLMRDGVAIASEVDLGVHFHTEPFVPSVEKGKKALRYMTADLALQAKTEMLNKPMALFKRLPWLEIRKTGHLSADLKFKKGLFLTGSRLGIAEMEILSRYKDLQVRGSGSVHVILADPVQDLEDISRANLEIQFADYRLEQDELDEPLVTGDGFHVLLESERMDLNRVDGIPGFDITINMPHSSVPDVRRLNGYLDKWDVFSFDHGSAEISANMVFDHNRGKGQGDITLSSESLGVVLHDRKLDGRFHFRTTFHEFDPGDPGFTFSAELKLENPEQNWHFNTVLSDGSLEWSIPYLEMGGRKVLSETSGTCGVTGDVSDIGFLNTFLEGQHGLKLNGPGSFAGRLALKAGHLTEGTFFRFDVPRIRASLMEYVAEGNASLTAAIHESDKEERMYRADLGLVIQDYEVRLEGVKDAHSGGKLLQADLEIPSFRLNESEPRVELRIKMPENTIYDMRTYNHLWGEDGAFEIVGGRGTSSGTFKFSGTGQSMEGRLLLHAPETRVLIDAILVTADLKFDGMLVSEDISKKKFNLAGSQLRLNDVYVGTESPDEKWKLMCQLGDTEIHWEKPLRISGVMSMTMTDSTPIVNYFVEQHDFLKHFSGLFDVKDIRGRGVFHLDERFMDVEELQIFGDVLQIDGKLRMNNEFKKGALLVRFHKVPLLVTMENGKKRPHLFGAKKKYDEFPVFSETDPDGQQPE